jgi:micrococcal nuclease
MRRLSLLALALALVAVAVLVVRGRGREPADAFGEARVVDVVDGDTIRVSARGHIERVRYIGIDTPESVKPDTPVQCFAERASAANSALVAGHRVRLVADAETHDRYGRLLAYVYREPDGIFVNARLVRGGYARTLTIPPNTTHTRELARLARAARTARRGLWRACPIR